MFLELGNKKQCTIIQQSPQTGVQKQQSPQPGVQKQQSPQPGVQKQVKYKINKIGWSNSVLPVEGPATGSAAAGGNNTAIRRGCSLERENHSENMYRVSAKTGGGEGKSRLAEKARTNDRTGQQLTTAD